MALVLREIALLLFGAVVVTACDLIHVLSGATTYTEPDFLGQPFWAPLLFAGAALAIVHGYLGLMRVARVPVPPLPRVGLLAPLAWFLAAYAASGLLYPWPAAYLLVAVGAFVFRLIWGGASPWKLRVVYALVVAAVSCTVESLLVNAGVFLHVRPDFAGIPMWLPALYLHVALLGEAFGRAFFARRV